MYQKTQFYFLILLLLSMLSCTKSTDENALKQRIDGLVNVVETHNEQEIKNYLATNFSAGKDGNKENFKLFVRYHFQRSKNISIVKANEKIKVNGSSADVTADVLLFGSNEWLPERGQKYFIESRWIKENENWVIERLRWRTE